MDTLSREITLAKLFGLSLERGLLLKERICSHREQILPFRVDPFSEWVWCAGKQTESHKSCLPCKKERGRERRGHGGDGVGLPGVSSPLNMAYWTKPNSGTFSMYMYIY